jgi:hypothetical protein
LIETYPILTDPLDILTINYSSNYNNSNDTSNNNNNNKLNNVLLKLVSNWVFCNTDEEALEIMKEQAINNNNNNNINNSSSSSSSSSIDKIINGIITLNGNLSIYHY